MSEKVLFFEDGLRYRWPQQRWLRTWLQSVVKQEGRRLDELRLVMCSEVRLRDLHAHYLSKDTDTDVLTFDFGPGTEAPIEGEVYLGLEQLRRQAKVWKVSFFEELCRVSVHGLLHLCGYDDATEAQKSTMRAAEDRYLFALVQTDSLSAQQRGADVSRETLGGAMGKSLTKGVHVSRETSMDQ